VDDGEEATSQFRNPASVAVVHGLTRRQLRTDADRDRARMNEIGGRLLVDPA